jgi:hypothetical protein
LVIQATKRSTRSTALRCCKPTGSRWRTVRNRALSPPSLQRLAHLSLSLSLSTPPTLHPHPHTHPHAHTLTTNTCINHRCRVCSRFDFLEHLWSVSLTLTLTHSLTHSIATHGAVTKLKEAGVTTIRTLQCTMQKDLVKIKGVTEARVRSLISCHCFIERTQPIRVEHSFTPSYTHQARATSSYRTSLSLSHSTHKM